MQLTMKRFALCVGLGILAQQLSAHHSFSVEFDANQTTPFEGVVAKVE
jgi:hypothetical protein